MPGAEAVPAAPFPTLLSGWGGRTGPFCKALFLSATRVPWPKEHPGPCGTLTIRHKKEIPHQEGN